MSVLDRSYHRWQGEPTPYLRRVLVIPEQAVRDMASQRVVLVLFMASLLPPLALAGVIYVAANLDTLIPSAQAAMAAGAVDIAGPETFAFVVVAQMVAAVLLTTFAGPRLISRDVVAGGLALYFSKALRRSDYVLGKCAVLFGMLSVATWIPLLLCWGLRQALAPPAAASEAWVAAAILVVLPTFALFLTTFMAAISAHVRRAWLAPFLFFAALVTALAFGNAVGAATGSDVGLLLSPWSLAARLHEWAFTPPATGARQARDLVASLVPLLVWTAGSAAVLLARLKPVEEIR